MTEQQRSSAPISDQEAPQQGSFVAGFSLGLLAGAAGYFLFGTKRGAELRHQLVEEWEKAQEHLAKEGMVGPHKLSLREFLQQISQEVFHASLPADFMTPAAPSPATKKTVKPPARKIKREGAKFSGV